MHPQKKLRSILAKLTNPPIARVFYRSVDYAALTSVEPPQPLWSLGPCKHGQRFSPVDGPPALYVSEKPYTSLLESSGISESDFQMHDNFQPKHAPLVTLAIDVKLQHILDLTDPEIQLAVGTDLSELKHPWKLTLMNGMPVPTHMLADTAYASHRFQSIRFPSAHHQEGVNLVIWTRKIRFPSFIEVHDPTGKLWQRLPNLRR